MTLRYESLLCLYRDMVKIKMMACERLEIGDIGVKESGN